MKSNRSMMLTAALAASFLTLAGMATASDCGATKAASDTHSHTMKAAATDTQPMNIVQTAAGAGSFKTLVAAVQAAGLVEALQGEGPFTVFAPTDEAFAKLPKGTVEELLKPENKTKLVAILTYHVVPGKVTSTDVVKVKSAKTAQGQDLAVQVKNGKVLIDNATVAKADVMASNGVIHVIDTVLLPKM